MIKKLFKSKRSLLSNDKSIDTSFDYEFYRDMYKDLSKFTKKGLESHWLKYGREEGRFANLDDMLKFYKMDVEYFANFDYKFYIDYYSCSNNIKTKYQAIEDYLLFGIKENRFKNNDEQLEYNHLKTYGFDKEYYTNKYIDNQDIQLDPILHYIRYGKEKGNNVRFIEKDNSSCLFGPILHNPLVSIIAVNYNGENDLPVFLDSLSEQSYRNFELLIVDNNSSDYSEHIVNKKRSQFKKLQFLQSGANLGFAEGNNFALPYCNGELIALINVDTRLDKDWLKELVDAMSQDATVAAVASKTLFFERFQDLKLIYKDQFSINLDKLVESLQYKKYFIRNGEVVDNKVVSVNDSIVISLPIQNETIQLDVNVNKEDAYLCLKKGKQKDILLHIDHKEKNIELDFSQDSVVNSSYIINNAGSITIDNMPGDRGLGEYDIGQYDSKCYVDFVCGVSMLLRRSSIVNREIFVPEFFAYYEDSELSRWISEEGHKILYAPKSILYHQHSATSSEGSPLWSLLVTRSREIYQHNYINKQEAMTLINTINHYEEFFKNDVPEGVYKQLKVFTKSLAKRLEVKNDVVKYRKAIAIYNTYWNTKGGGESHALAFAAILQKDTPVYLVSENDFDIQELSEYYHLDLNNCYKLIETKMTPEFTKKFDIFINSTYRSNLISYAKKSYYIVSFPHEDIIQEVLDSYTFLYNSGYTKKWAEIFWGTNHKSDIVYPIGMIQSPKIKHLKKEKIILSVGRFFVGAHSKNQHIIAEAFNKLIQKNPIFSDWKLVLIGSLNINSEDDVCYVKQIEENTKGANTEIILNASRDILQTYFEKASIYIHASGYGQDAENDPEKFEHFGITPVEAMINGCYPIVYEVGGPAELIKKLEIGRTFRSIDELVEILKSTEEDTLLKDKVKSKILEFIEENSFEKKLTKIKKD